MKRPSILLAITAAVLLSLIIPEANAGDIEGVCVRFCGGGGGGGGGGQYGNQIGELFDRLGEKRLRQENYESHAEKTYGPVVSEMEGRMAIGRTEYEEGLLSEARAEEARLANVEHTVTQMNNWNDVGVISYQSGKWGASLRQFRNARRYAPGDQAIKGNIIKAEAKVRADAVGYLRSVGTAWAIFDLTPHLLIFHPDPSLRKKANEELAKDAMKKVAEGAAVFALNEHLNGGKLEPFDWETPEERAARRDAVLRDAIWLDEVYNYAFSEVRSKQTAFKEEVATGGILITPGPALTELLELTFTGFDVGR